MSQIYWDNVPTLGTQDVASVTDIERRAVPLPMIEEITQAVSSATVVSQRSTGPFGAIDNFANVVGDEDQSRQSSGSTTFQTPGEVLTSRSFAGVKRRADDSGVPFKTSKKRRMGTDEREAFAQAEGPAPSLLAPQIFSSDYFVIAHSSSLQAKVDRLNLPWGVQYELARLSTSKRLQLDNLTEADLRPFCGTNAEAAPLVAKKFRRTTKGELQDIPDEMAVKYYQEEKQRVDPWAELDREEHLLCTNSSTRLGDPSRPDAYAGRIAQVVHLAARKDTKKRKLPIEERVEFVMDRQEKGKSCRATRFYGSRRFLQISIDKDLLSDPSLQKFLSRRFVLMGRVYRAFASKDKSVHLVETDENLGRTPMGLIDRGRLSFEDFLKWHNPWEQNKAQGMAKWAARYHLALSTTVPSVRFRPDHILRQDDIISSSYHGPPGKAPSEMIMTDGCGYLTRSVFQKLKEQFGLIYTPCAVQARLAGTKGMFIMRPEDDDDLSEMTAWYKPSQLKIAMPPVLEESQLRLDVVRLPHVTCPSRLSGETLINLAENGVPIQVFIDLLQLTLDTIVKALTTWDGPQDMVRLWKAVCDLGHVMGERLRRQSLVSARARGYGDEKFEDDQDEDADIQVGRGGRWCPDPISGLPATLQETVMEFVVSGFHPLSNPILFEKLRQVLLTEMNQIVWKYKIDPKRSLGAFIVPDPTGLLKEGEIFFKFSSPNTIDGVEVEVLTGDVLVGRHPTKLATDIRKVQAVDITELHYLKDVVVFPVQGEVSLASILAGGDYDGDTVFVIWEPSIVQPFQNADVEATKAPPDLMSYFNMASEQVQDFLRSSEDLPPEARLLKAQEYLLRGLSDPSAVGMYSNYHALAAYKLGYKHPITILLAHLFCQQLDGAKSGLTIKPERRRKDANEWNGYEAPEWRNPEGANKSTTSKRHMSKRKLKRPPDLGPFVLTALLDHGKKAASVHDVHYKAREPRMWKKDEVLEKPYQDALARCQAASKFGMPLAQKELDDLTQSVRNIHSCHCEQVRGAKGFTDRNITTRQEILRRLSAQFRVEASNKAFIFFSSEDILTVMASYACTLEPVKGFRFPYDVAFRTLCEIKAKSIGPTHTVVTDIHEQMAINKRFLDIAEEDNQA